MSEFLASQGVLEMSRWHVLGARVSGNGKVLTGTAFPLAADYYHGYRLELDQVFICHDKRRGARHCRWAFPRRWTRICGTATRSDFVRGTRRSERSRYVARRIGGHWAAGYATMPP